MRGVSAAPHTSALTPQSEAPAAAPHSAAAQTSSTRLLLDKDKTQDVRRRNCPRGGARQEDAQEEGVEAEETVESPQVRRDGEGCHLRAQGELELCSLLVSLINC